MVTNELHPHTQYEFCNGIIATDGNIDTWLIGNNVYRAKHDDQLNVYGYPQGKRWECSYKLFLEFKNTVFKHLSIVDAEVKRR